MDANKVRTHLETATNVVVLAVVTIIIAIFAWGFFAQNSSPNIQKGLQKGTVFAALPPHDFGAARRTIVLAMNSSCGYCNESIAFYRQVVEAANKNNVQVIAISQEKEISFKKYLSQSQLNIDARPQVDLNSYGIAATPTAILIDENGLILDFWVGKLSQESEKQVIKALMND